MRKLLCILLVLVSLGGCAVSDFKIIVPEFGQNHALNPSGEIAGNFTGQNGGIMTRVTTHSHYGLYSYRIQTAAHGQGGVVNFSALANAIHFVTVRVAGTLPPSWRWTVDAGATYHEPTLLKAIDGTWSLYGYQFPAAECVGSLYVFMCQDGGGAGDFFVDGVQPEEKEYWTTYIDGTRPGCEWIGTPHASISQRSAQVRAGGRVRDLETDYALDISGMVGVGTPPQSVFVDEFALTPGGSYSRTKIHPRTFLLNGAIHGTGLADLHAKRQALAALFDVKAFPENQPVTLRYVGAPVEKEIQVYYERGLEGVLRADADACNKENIALQVTAPDPMWYEVGQSSEVLDILDTPTYRTVAGRLKSTGQWDVLGPPNAVGGYHIVEAVEIAPNKSVYFGGHFTNFDNNVSNSYVTRWDPVAGTWNPLGVGLDDTVRTIAIGPDGQVYLAGQFTDIRTNPGGGTYNYVVRWNPVTSTYHALGAGFDDDVTTLVFGHNGILYAGGYFHQADGAPAFHVAQWDGVAWTPIDVGLQSNAYDSAVGLDGGIYFVGDFVDIRGGPGNTYSKIIKWNPGTSTWTSLTNGRLIDGPLWGVDVHRDGRVYFGGIFEVIDAEVFNNVGMWNHTALVPLANGVNAQVETVEIGPTGLVYFGGRMTAADDIPMDHLAIWDGTAWVYADIKMPNAEAIWDIAIGAPDHVQNYDVYLAGSIPLGNESRAGKITVTNPGTAPAHPSVVVSRSSGASATLMSLRNETTGKIIRFNYGLLDGEILTINLEPTNQGIISSFWGAKAEARLASSDFGTFTLRPGDNEITCLVHGVHADFNDDNDQLSEWEGIRGFSDATTDAGRLYITIVDVGAGWFRVDIYRDVAKAAGDLVGHTVNYNAPGLRVVSEDNGSGLYGHLRIDAVVGADADIYVDLVIIETHIEFTNTYKSFD